MDPETGGSVRLEMGDIFRIFGVFVYVYFFLPFPFNELVARIGSIVPTIGNIVAGITVKEVER